MPGGRPKKKGGKPKREDVDLKLPKVRREAAVKKLRRPVNEAMVEQNNNDDGDRKVEEEVLEELEGEVEVSKGSKQGRPSLSPAGPMNADQLRQRMKEVNKARREETKMSERQEQISKVRKEAAELRWKNEEERKKQHKPEKCDEEVLGLLPDGHALKLDILREAIPNKKSRFYGHFPYGGGGLNPIP